MIRKTTVLDVMRRLLQVKQISIFDCIKEALLEVS